jgi:hypothetical protein
MGIDELMIRKMEQPRIGGLPSFSCLFSFHLRPASLRLSSTILHQLQSSPRHHEQTGGTLFRVTGGIVLQPDHDEDEPGGPFQSST